MASERPLSRCTTDRDGGSNRDRIHHCLLVKCAAGCDFHLYVPYTYNAAVAFFTICSVIIRLRRQNICPGVDEIILPRAPDRM